MESKYEEFARAEDEREQVKLEEKMAKKQQEYLKLQERQKDIGLHIALLKSTLNTQAAQGKQAKSKEKPVVLPAKGTVEWRQKRPSVYKTLQKEAEECAAKGDG